MSLKAAIWILATAVLLSAHPASADEASKSAKLQELMVLQGRKEAAQRQLDVHKRQMMEMGARAMEEHRTQAGLSLDDAQYKQMQKAYDRFLDESLPPWTAEESTKLYAELLARDLDESDIDALLEFYRSPVGRKSNAAVHRASAEWQEILGRKAQESILARYRDLLSEMSKIVGDDESKRGRQ